jgi:hypothetical protein
MFRVDPRYHRNSVLFGYPTSRLVGEVDGTRQVVEGNHQVGDLSLEDGSRLVLHRLDIGDVGEQQEGSGAEPGELTSVRP